MFAEPLRSIFSHVSELRYFTNLKEDPLHDFWCHRWQLRRESPDVLDHSLNPQKVWCVWKKYLQEPLHKHDKAWLCRFPSHGTLPARASARKPWCYQDTVQSSRHQYTKRAKHEEHVWLELLQCTAEASRSYLGEWFFITQMFIKFHQESSTFITHPENKLRWYPQQPQRATTFYFYKSFWSMLRSQALETPQLGFRESNGRKSC